MDNESTTNPSRQSSSSIFSSEHSNPDAAEVKEKDTVSIDNLSRTKTASEQFSSEDDLSLSSFNPRSLSTTRSSKADAGSTEATGTSGRFLADITFEGSNSLEALWSQFGARNPFYYTLEYNAVKHPNEDAVVWLNIRSEVEARLSFQKLLSQVQHLADHLRYEKKLQPSHRAILAFPPSSGLDFIVAFYACLAIGVIAVPVYPVDPSKAAIDSTRFTETCNAAGAQIVLTNSTYKKVVKIINSMVRSDTWMSLDWVSTTNVSFNAKTKFIPTDVTPDSTAFLQFTSGSTSAPKGVMVTHGSLLHNCHLVVLACSFPSVHEDPAEVISAEDYCLVDFRDEFWPQRHAISQRVLGHRVRAFSWLPIYHDMGLIGCTISPITFGLTVYQMSPMDFIRRPHTWLQAMSKYECFTTGAPNFAFELVTRKMPDDVYQSLDLSKVTSLLCGAEPIRKATYDAFMKKFAPKGFRECSFLPAYGLAEHTLIVAGRRTSSSVPSVISVDATALADKNILMPLPPFADGDNAKTFIGCGCPMRGVDVRIVDPETRCELEPLQIGEIWVRSHSVASGYFHDEAKSVSIFSNFLSADDKVAKGMRNFYMRTGDMGVIHDGELYVTGRLKDIIIIRGRKYYPQDIEQAVESCGQIRKGCVAAFALEGAEHDAVGVAAEIRTVVRNSTRKGVFHGGFFSMAKNCVRRMSPASHQGQNRALAEEISASVFAATALKLKVLWLLKPKTIPKTTSGKIRRALTRDRLTKNTFKAVVQKFEFPLPTSKELKKTDS